VADAASKADDMTNSRNWDGTSFIDIAVQDGVREAMLSGQAALIVDRKSGALRWANGAAAGLFGLAAIGSRAGEATLSPAAETGMRQVRAVLGALKDEPRTALVRLRSGLTSRLVKAHVRRIDLAGVRGKHALVTAPARDTEMTDAECMAIALTGLEDEGAGAAIIDGGGRVLSAGASYGALGVSDDMARDLAARTRGEADRLVKQIVDLPETETAIAAGVGRLADLPERYLIVALALADRPAEPAPIVAAPVVDLMPGDFGAMADTDAEPPAADDTDEAMPQVMTDDNAMGNGAYTGEELDEAPETAPAEPAAKPAPAPFDGPDLNSGPIRFVWKTDRDGVFIDVSPEFSRAVGPNAAELAGHGFADIVDRLALDPAGEIAAALSRRDTWSGKSVLWPIQETDQQVPVDLAALPYYSREREFEGYRGFGIARMADIATDPDARGLALTTPFRAPAEPDADLSDRHILDDEAAHFEADGGPDEALGIAGMDEHDLSHEPPVLAVAPAHPMRRSSDTIVLFPDAAADELDDIAPGPHLSDEEAEAFRKIGQALGRRDDGVETGRVDGQTHPAPTGDEPDLADQPGEEAFEAEDRQPFEPDIEAPVAEDRVTEDHDDEHDRHGLTDDVTPLESDGSTLEDAPFGEPWAETSDEDDAPDDDNGATLSRDGLAPETLDELPLPLLIVRNERALYTNVAFAAMAGDADTDALNARGLDMLFGGSAPDTEDNAGDRAITLVGADGEPIAARAHLQIVPWMGARALMFAFEPRPLADDTLAAEAALPGATASAGAFEPSADAAASDPHAVSAAEVAELRAILDTATDGVILIGADSTIRSLNGSAAALFGYSNEEIEGKSFSFLFAHESQRAAMDYLHGLSNNGVASVLNEGREVLGRERNGGFLPLFMTIGRMPATNGFCAVIRDITPWKQTEQALQDAKRQAEQASNTKSEFLAKISHEIRTPLNAIIGFSELMAEERFGPIGNERYRDYLADINKSGRHVLDLVNDLLDISKIEAGKQELEFESVALNEAIGEAIAMVQPQANRNQIIVRSSLESTVPPVVADLRSIKQIVLNLLSNAIRFTHAGGQVIVSTSYTGDGAVLLRIRDSGIGMSEKELESALKPFQQVTAVGQRRGDGTGLGLPLTKALVEANRAEFGISSEPGQGTRVDIIFPPARVLAS
jgi:PAS domain S-box-containing protein